MKIAIWIIAVIIIIAAVVLWVRQSHAPGTLDDFAKCLGQKGAQFYGAFWCPHCQNQKKEFGNSAKYLPYVECSTPDGNGQLQSCTDKGVKGYPTWVFADGSRSEGEMSLQALAQKTGCTLPQGH